MSRSGHRGMWDRTMGADRVKKPPWRVVVFMSIVVVTLLGASALGSPPGVAADEGTVTIEPIPVKAPSLDVGTILVRGQGIFESTDLDDEHDLRTVAESLDLDLQWVRERTRGQNEFNIVVADVARRYPDIFVTAGVPPLTDESKSAFWIATTTKPSVEVLEMLRELPVDVEVRYGAPGNADQLEQAAGDLVTAATESPAITAAIAGYKPDQQILQIDYAAAHWATADELSAALSAAVSSITDARGELPLPVLAVEDPGSAKFRREVTVQGGRPLRDGWGVRQCTAGFTAKRANKGVLTAWHCDSPLRYGYNAMGDVLSASPVVPNTPLYYYDVQFFRTVKPNGHTTNRQFRATGTTSSDDRTVQDVGFPSIFSVICHWGDASATESCGWVIDTHLCGSDDGQTTCGMAKVVGCISEVGDSGGPWFWQNTAIGIHVGSDQDGDCLLTRIGKAESVLGVEVLQQ